MFLPKRILCGAFALLALALVGGTAASADPNPVPKYAAPNSSPYYLQTYDGNLENLPTARASARGTGRTSSTT